MQVRFKVEIHRDAARPRRSRRRVFALAGVAALALCVPVAFAADTFTDVPSTHPFHDQIERTYAAGMIGACGATTFCPGNTVTKGMAANQYDKAFGLDGTPRPFTPTWRQVNVKTGGSTPPFTVDSSAKVDNLNADQLDGQDSSAFLPAGGKAADSDKIDGQDSTAFQRVCGRGSVLAWGLIDEASASTAGWSSTSGVGPHYNCASSLGQIFVKKLGTGHVQIAFPGISDDSLNSGRMVATTTVAQQCPTCDDYYTVATDPTMGKVIDITTQYRLGATDVEVALALYGYGQARIPLKGDR